MVRRLSLKSFKFKIQKSQMQLHTRLSRDIKSKVNEKKNRGRIRVLHTTRAHPSRCSVVRESNTTDPKSYMAVNLQFRGGCLFKHEKPWPPIAIVHGIRPFIKLH